MALLLHVLLALVVGAATYWLSMQGLCWLANKDDLGVGEIPELMSNEEIRAVKRDAAHSFAPFQFVSLWVAILVALVIVWAIYAYFDEFRSEKRTLEKLNTQEILNSIARTHASADNATPFAEWSWVRWPGLDYDLSCYSLQERPAITGRDVFDALARGKAVYDSRGHRIWISGKGELLVSIGGSCGPGSLSVGPGERFELEV